jgi:hypothetical protein
VEFLTRLYLLRLPVQSRSDRVFDERTLSAMGDVIQRLAARNPAAVFGSPGEPFQRDLAERIGSPMRGGESFAFPDGRDSAPATDGVLRELDSIASEFGRSEVVVLLHLGAIRAAIGRALESRCPTAFSPEVGQAIALDWPHPAAREFRPALIGIGFDWQLARASEKVHRFPGGASVLPRGS